jgi:hypothetical protein
MVRTRPLEWNARACSVVDIPPGLAIPPKIDGKHTSLLFKTTETSERVRS